MEVMDMMEQATIKGLVQELFNLAEKARFQGYEREKQKPKPGDMSLSPEQRNALNAKSDRQSSRGFLINRLAAGLVKHKGTPAERREQQGQLIVDLMLEFGARDRGTLNEDVGSMM